MAAKVTDIEIHAREILRIREMLNDILVRHTGQDAGRISKDTDRDYWMSAEQAVAYGLVGKIVTSHSEII